MNPGLEAALTGGGAVLDPVSSRPLHFGDAAAELRSALDGCVLSDRSDMGRVLAAGPDALDLLHRLSTNTVKDLSPGAGCSTVLTSNKGRIVERLFVHHLGAPGVLLVSGPGSAGRVIAHIDRYTFAERTELSDTTGSIAQLAVIGPRAADALRSAGLPVPDGTGAVEADLEGAEVHVIGSDGFSASGFSVTCAAENEARVWTMVLDGTRGAGGRAAGDLAVESWRVLLGLPAAGNELTGDHNPLEAGLWDSVDFDKGCYVGQEVVARLNTYDKVSRSVKGLVLPEGCTVPGAGAPLFHGTRAAGEVTSALVPPGRRSPVVLAYVKRGFFEAGTALTVGEAGATPAAEVLDLPFGETR